MLLEHLPPGDWDTARRNFERLRDVLETGGRAIGIRTGVSSATWTAAVASAPVVIPHGLGKIPVFAEAASRNGLIHYVVGARDATNITVTGFVTYNAAFTGGPIFFDWVAIG